MLTKNWKICGYKVPTYPLFMVSGFLCDVIQGCIFYILSLFYTIDREATICWTLSYSASIVVRHTSHRLVVFGEYEGSYWSSLGRTYISYASSIVISTFMMHYLDGGFGLERKYAYVITTLGTGIYNYFALKASWRPKNAESTVGSQSEKESLASNAV